MPVRFARGFSFAALLLMCSAATAHAQFTREDSTRWIAPAVRFVDAVRSGDYAAAAAMASPASPPGVFTPARLEELWRTVTGQTGQLRTTVPLRHIAASGAHQVDFDAIFERASLTMRVVLDSAALVTGFGFLPPEQPPDATPPPYADTSRFSESSLTFGLADWKLEGTLSVPRNVARPPVLILVHGSGPNDRDETLGPNKPFRDMAYGLASRGIAVFRYDKRTFVHSARMRAASVTVAEEVVDDALLAIAAMRQQTAVDSTRVFVLGHSLGGMLLPEIAESDGRLAGIILAAAPARPFADVLAEQLAYLDSLARASGDTANANIRTIRREIDSLRTGRLADSAMVMGVPAGYWYELGRLNPIATANRQPSPILVLQGGRDYQVTMQDFGMWQAALAPTGRATFHAYPDLNHLFITGTGKALPSEYSLKSGHVAPAVIEQIAAWMSSR